jgi:membrane-associated phospholipid phosphatase
MFFETSTVESVQEPFPPWAIDAFAVVTDFGDPLFFIVLVSLVYWLTDHQTAIWLVAALMLGFGLTVGLKEVIAIERPPAAVQHIPADGNGIPSGHTSGAVTVYGALAALYSVGPRRLRYAAAAIAAGLVGLSRVVLGVHYVADVIGGAVLGLAVIAVVLWARDHDRSPLPFFVVGAGAALAGAVLSGFAYRAAVLQFGAALAAAVCWPLVDPLPDTARRVMAACGVVALPLVLGLAIVGLELFDSPVALIASTAAAMAVVLTLPHVGDRVGRWYSARGTPAENADA